MTEIRTHSLQVLERGQEQFGQLTPFAEEFKNQALHPPSNDRTMHACYETIFDLLQSDQNVQNFFSRVTTQREFTPEHLVNLTFRVIQYNEMFVDKTEDYPYGLDTQDAWREKLPQLFDPESDKGKLIEELLVTKDTTTTKFQRYAGAATILNAFFPNGPLSVADFGCGGNHGLPGLKKGIPFEQVTDETPDQLVSRLSPQIVNISRGLAVDQEDPNNLENFKWRIACSFYPKELPELEKLLALDHQLQDTQGIAFLQGDLLNLDVNHRDGTLPEDTFDAVIMSTMLYQHSPEDQARIIESAKKTVKKKSAAEDRGGLIIIQDFAVVDEQDPTKIRTISDWFKNPWSYRTIIAGDCTNWEMKEVLQAENGRAKKFKPGKDYAFLASQMQAALSR